LRDSAGNFLQHKKPYD